MEEKISSLGCCVGPRQYRASSGVSLSDLALDRCYGWRAGAPGAGTGDHFPATFHYFHMVPREGTHGCDGLNFGGLDVGAALGMMLMPTYLVTSGGDPFSSITRSATESGDAEDEGSTASSSLRSAGRIWQAHYYVFAIAGVMLSAAAYKLVSSTPEWHPRISLPEVQHITKDRPKPIGLLDLNQVAAIEWRTLVTHPALLAIYGTHTICCLVFHLALIYLPFLFAERFGIPSSTSSHT